MPRFVTATLVRHSSEDGLVTMWEHVPLGKQYEVDMDSITVQKFQITAPGMDKHEYHHKEIIYCKASENGVREYLCTEMLFIPGHTAKRIYTHKDKDGVLWRFDGGRPISKIADDIMDESGFNEQQQQ